MTTLKKQLANVLPQIYRRASAMMMTGQQLLPLVRPMLVHSVPSKKYSEKSILVEISKMSRPNEKDSPIVKAKTGQGYHLRTVGAFAFERSTASSRNIPRKVSIVQPLRPGSRSIPKLGAIWAQLEEMRGRFSHKGIFENQAFPDCADLFLGLDAAGQQMLYLKCELEEGQGGDFGGGEYDEDGYGDEPPDY